MVAQIHSWDTPRMYILSSQLLHWMKVELYAFQLSLIVNLM
jgi:hypothetical protein